MSSNTYTFKMPVVARSCNEIEHSSYSKLLHSGISIDKNSIAWHRWERVHDQYDNVLPAGLVFLCDRLY
jgi:hypothetical protein